MPTMSSGKASHPCATQWMSVRARGEARERNCYQMKDQPAQAEAQRARSERSVGESVRVFKVVIKKTRTAGENSQVRNQSVKERWVVHGTLGRFQAGSA